MAETKEKALLAALNSSNLSLLYGPGKVDEWLDFVSSQLARGRATANLCIELGQEENWYLWAVFKLDGWVSDDNSVVSYSLRYILFPDTSDQNLKIPSELEGEDFFIAGRPELV